jgi:uncharacterized low-complexity protein
MSEKNCKPLALAVGLALAGSLAGTSVAQADASPFAVSALSSGYMASAHLGEGKCGGTKGEEGKCGEGKCGGQKGEGDHEGKEGEGKCGGDKGEEGKCGGDKKEG